MTHAVSCFQTSSLSTTYSVDTFIKEGDEPKIFRGRHFDHLLTFTTTTTN